MTYDGTTGPGKHKTGAEKSLVYPTRQKNARLNRERGLHGFIEIHYTGGGVICGIFYRRKGIETGGIPVG